jgi:hypothetical protein
VFQFEWFLNSVRLLHAQDGSVARQAMNNPERTVMVPLPSCVVAVICFNT